MNVYRITDDDDGLTVLARTMPEALAAWRWHARKAGAGEDYEARGCELLTWQGAVVVSAEAMALLQTPERAWTATGKGVLWDVQPMNPETGQGAT